MNKVIPFTALFAALATAPASAADQFPDSGKTIEHGAISEADMMHGETGAGATGQGVINSVDTDKRIVNITHGPIPALSWPGMTMDLPVTKDVDLNGMQPGDKVRFHIALGADQVYRITAIDPTP
ncbi:MAG: copper-binding protein [Thiohalocapsa sp.]|jgi:Cu(I)/Ag(I) efflux system protein CusF|uniref:copper-binding protein n=1 Tax=Thiohalocapsa sp. TaxID=2497641 RepID=UPI0025F1574E|nr:copper-binding protein [Thiohalocapsa sp.]MCG6941668.1 copper-binding protein [Thiohalocapsa sp.]